MTAECLWPGQAGRCLPAKLCICKEKPYQVMSYIHVCRINYFLPVELTLQVRAGLMSPKDITRYKSKTL